MSVKVENLTVRRYTGLASDQKPTTNDSAPGSIFTETDTGDKYTYDGTMWKRTESPIGVLMVLYDIKDALDQHAILLEEIRDKV